MERLQKCVQTDGDYAGWAKKRNILKLVFIVRFACATLDVRHPIISNWSDWPRTLKYRSELHFRESHYNGASQIFENFFQWFVHTGSFLLKFRHRLSVDRWRRFMSPAPVAARLSRDCVRGTFIRYNHA
jgi:hypothetical protein